MSSKATAWDAHLDSETRSFAGERGVVRPGFVPGLTVLAHPDPRRTGEEASLAELVAGREASVSRLAPLFAQPSSGAEARPLADPSLSRTPLSIRSRPDGGYAIARGGCKMVVRVDGGRMDDETPVSRDALNRGVVIELGPSVVVVLGRLALSPRPRPLPGIIGDGESMMSVRRHIERVAELDRTVLIRGETGTGKELVARALHAGSRRARSAFEAVNLAALSDSLVESELFGSARGAFTGADRDRDGLFHRARGGTLFLDELGEASPRLQAALLRVLEENEFRRVGGQRSERADARIIAATDADLESRVAEERFRSPLLNRLASFTISMPPLRERRADIGRLFFHFLRQVRRSVASQSDRSLPRDLDVPAWLVARCACHPWPGNVRQLRKMVERWALSAADGDDSWQRDLESIFGDETQSARDPGIATEAGTAAEAGDSRRKYRDIDDVTVEDLRDALDRCEGNILQTSKALGVSRGSLYSRIERSPEIRIAGSLARPEIESALEAEGGRVARAARRLGVSVAGLKQRMRALGLTPR